MAAPRQAAAPIKSSVRLAQGSASTTARQAQTAAPPQIRTIFDSLWNSTLGTCETRTMTHTKVLPYTSTTVFRAVSDVGGYPNFLPFTISSTVKARDSKGYPTKASLKVGYATIGVEEDWDSVVHCDPAKGTIEAKSSDANSGGLFETLSTKWLIAPSKTSKSSTAVKLDVKVKFRNPVYDQMFAQIEGKVADRMISAFEKRAEELEKSKKNKP